MQEFIHSHFENLRPPASETDITLFERRHTIVMPESMRQFYLLANGGALVRHDIYEDGEYTDHVNRIADIEGIASYYRGISRNNRDVGYVIKEIGYVMPIANTSGRNSVFIGHTGLYKDKIYISGELDDETGIIPITWISESFTRFIADLR